MLKREWFKPCMHWFQHSGCCSEWLPQLALFFSPLERKIYEESFTVQHLLTLITLTEVPRFLPYLNMHYCVCETSLTMHSSPGYSWLLLLLPTAIIPVRCGNMNRHGIFKNLYTDKFNAWLDDAILSQKLKLIMTLM